MMKMKMRRVTKTMKTRIHQAAEKVAQVLVSTN